MALRKLSLGSDLENELWVLMEEMRQEHKMHPNDCSEMMRQAWEKTREDWEREFPKIRNRQPV
ncbi:MAG: hypothetical protein JJ902_04165 [Roseibium sp.]|nr:hypothetical protein [Roseibium sp.]